LGGRVGELERPLVPGRLAGRRVDDGQHVGGIDRQPVLAQRSRQLPRPLEGRDGGGDIAA
jgi:hypothetical protein